MEFWQKAQALAEQAAKRTTELTTEAAKRSRDLTIGSSKLSDIVSEASKKSKEIAAEASKRADLIKLEASKRADQFRTEALKRADQIKSQIPSLLDSSPSHSPSPSQSPVVTPEDLQRFGVTDELREFLKEITANTFRDFPLEDNSEMSDIPTISNVRQDLTEWQERHAKYVLLTVKAISKLRYELCPRVMKERKFWRIYFILVNSHVAPWEKRYNEEAKQKSAEKVKEDAVKETSAVATAPKTEKEGIGGKSKIPTSTAADRDLDVFLLGDLDSDDNSDDGDAGFDDDLDKI